MLFNTGRLIGAYEILGLLGKGGMGEVYRARDTRLGRLVAIKIVSADLQADAAATDRLKREARLASSLNHPAIVTVYDVGEVEGQPFIVMELIEGHALSSRLTSGPLPVREAMGVACEVADGLAAAHAAGMVHRDLKPQNIMVTAEGAAKVVDFGLSKETPALSGPEEETASPDALTAAHTMLGTAGYMAPEQVSGSPVTHRADQFALGVVLYEMLTGRRAFKRETTIQTLAAIVGDEPAPILEYCPLAPPALITIVDRCLAKRPKHRYDSTRDLARDLRDVRDLLSSSGSRPTAWRAPDRRRLWIAGAVVTIAVAAMVSIGYVLSKAGGGQAPFRQVVVLPFTCGSPGSVDQVFCDGLAETLTSGLAELQRFDPTWRVVSQEVAQRDMPSDSVNAESARLMLGATIALTGAMARDGATTRVTLSRVDAASDRSQFTEIAMGEDAGLPLALVSMAAALVDVDLTPPARAAVEAGGATVSGAYESYVLGRGYLHPRMDANLDAAIGALERAVQADGSFALAHVALCEAYWRQYKAQTEPAGDPSMIDRARSSCRTAIQLDEALVPVHMTLARMARGQGHKEEAIASARRAVEFNPTSSDAVNELAEAYVFSEQMDAAVATYTAALEVWPDDPQVYSDLCRFHGSRQDWAGAEAPCRHALQLTPDSTRVLNNLGAALLMQEQREEAAAKFQRSLEIRPTLSAAQNLGVYDYGLGHYAAAAQAFEKAAALNGNNLEVWRSLGAALYWSPGERPSAAEAYEQVVRLAERARQTDPRNPKLVGQLADAYSLLGRPQDARDTLEALDRLPMDDLDTDVLFLVASVHEQLGNREQALGWLERALAAGYSRDQIDRSPFLAELRKDDEYARLVTQALNKGEPNGRSSD